MGRACVAFVLVFGAGVLSAQNLELQQGTFSFTDATPEGAVAAFGCGVELRTLVPIWRFEQEVVRADRNRLAVWQPRAPLPSRGYWVMADLTTGRWARTMLPSDGSLLRSAAGARVSSGAREILVVGGRDIPTLLAVWVVRAGTGAWGAFVRDGSADDLDGSVNGNVRVDLKKLKPLPPSQTLDELQSGDLIFWTNLRDGVFGEHVVGEEGERQ
ncbi:hypothetical protein HRbin09_00133 [bacterium HR09]|nr:hypothetical protein HRbin09_00133 [bacterium HR09]